MTIRRALAVTAAVVTMAVAPGLITSVGFPKLQQTAALTAAKVDLGPENFQSKH